MPGTGLGWFDATPPAAPLPYGWTDADVATLLRVSHELGIDPLEVAALLYSESGMNPKSSPSGLAGLTPIVETEMGWPSGTIAQLNAGPITTYLQAVFQLWTHVQEKYVGKTFVAKGQQWNVSPGTALYVFHGFLGPALSASTRASVLGVKPPVWPVVWSGGGWRYNGAPVRDVLGRNLTGQEALYAGNPGLDARHSDTITIGDMAARVARKSLEAQSDPAAGAVLKRMAQIAQLPPDELPTLGSLFGAVKAPWEALTGTPVRTSSHSDVTPEESPNTPRGAPETSTAGTGGGALLLFAALLAGAWYVTRRR